jgi:tRNA pseudouridine38-40 synthase
MPRYKLTIEYDGTSYHGWQRQEELPTVQEEIEKAIQDLCGEYLTLHCSGRTDAGVHALGQVAHIDLPQTYELFKIRDALNYYLKPHPIAILKAEEVSQDFHARFSTTKRSYIYKIINRYSPLTLDKNRAWQVPRKLNVEAMQDACEILIGQHDFTTFRASECQALSPIKTMDELIVTHKENDIIEIFVKSRSFLHHQVRNMVGSLKLVGDGRWNKQDLKDALEAKDRTKGGPTAPAGGLYLFKIDY